MTELIGIDISAKTALLERLQDLWRAKRQGSYDVHRGFPNWSSWQWDKGRVAAVNMPETTIGKIQNDGTVTFHLVTRMPGPAAGIIDRTLDEMAFDAVEVMNEMNASKDAQGRALIYGIHEESATMAEFSDTEYGIQGLLVSFDVTY